MKICELARTMNWKLCLVTFLFFLTRPFFISVDGDANPPGRSSPPANVLILMTDQQRFDSLSCYGSRTVKTPNVDRLAKEGALFERCYAPNPICTPIRASMLTGKTVLGHGVYRLHDILPAEEILLPQRLRRLGYHTSLVGKLHVSGIWHEAEKRHPNDGFDDYFWCEDPALNLDSPFNAYARWVERKDPAFYARLRREGKMLKNFPSSLHHSKWAADTTIELIRRKRSDRPFFILMSLFDPHDPYFGHPVESAALVDEQAIAEPQPSPPNSSLPIGVRREWEKSQSILRSTREYQDGTRGLRGGYYASIAFLDQQFGRVLDVLEQEGLARNTLVVFLSDHGDMLFDRGLFSKGAFFYDPSVRVPLLMRLPGRIPAGSCVQDLVQHMDIPATILSLAGYNRDQQDAIYPHAMDLIRMISDGPTYEYRRGYAVCVYRNSGYGPDGRYFDPPINATMFHDGRYKLNVFHGLNAADEAAAGELYDMEADPTEAHNLWNDPGSSQKKRELLGRMLGWMVDSDTRLWGSRGGEKFRESVMREYRK